MKHDINDQSVTDKLFIQEIINDLFRMGIPKQTKALTNLCDWSKELRDKTHIRGCTKKLHRVHVGKQLY